MGHKEYVQKSEDPNTLIKCQFKYPDGALCEAFQSHDVHHLSTDREFHGFIPSDPKLTVNQLTISLEGM